QRFYNSARGLSFDVIDQYFRLHGFDKTAGMTLKPSRKILARVREVSGLLHPREHIHVIAPGDPIFQSGGEASITPTRRTKNGSQSDRYLNQPPPNVIVTSQRILV